MNEPTLSLRMLTSAQAAGVISEATRTRFSPRLSSSAAATRRNSSWVPVSSSAATPTRQGWASPVLLQPVLMPAEVSRPGSNKPRGRRHQRWRQAEHAVEDRNQRGHYEGPLVPVGLSTPAWPASPYTASQVARATTWSATMSPAARSSMRIAWFSRTTRVVVKCRRSRLLESSEVLPRQGRCGHGIVATKNADVLRSVMAVGVGHGI